MMAAMAFSRLRPSLLLRALLPVLVVLLASPGRGDDGAPLRPILLRNGVRLVLQPDPSARSVAIAVFVRLPRDVGAPQVALGDMVAHALWYASAERTAEWTAHTVDQVGGSLETLHTPDYVAFSCVTTPGRVEEAAGMFCETLKHADFTPEALAHARHDILEERRRRSETGFTATEDRIQAALSGEDVPDSALFDAVSQARAQDYFRSRYLPDRTVIAVTGDFAPAEVQTDFEAHLFEYDRTSRQQLEYGTSAMPFVRPAPIPPLSVRGDAAYALVGVPAPRVDSPDYPAYTVLRSLLGVGHASRLFRRLRDQLGLGYRVGASWRSDLAAPMIAYLEWDANRTSGANAAPALTPDAALHRLNGELDALLTDPPNDAELARARGIAIGQDALRHERVRDRAFLLGWYESMGVGYDFDSRFPGLLQHVTREDVLRIARVYLSSRAPALAVPAETQNQSRKAEK